MADYANLQAAIDAGIDNMTCLRNNSGNDDGLSGYGVDASWFKFNGVSVSYIYSSGNSWLGLGTNSEQLRVNRRDAKVWYEYQETGKIGKYQFLKFRWCGYSQYSTTSADYKQQWDVYLIEGGIIFLDFFSAPIYNCDGTNSLTADSAVTFTVTAGTPCEWTFTPSDPENGKGYTATEGRPNLVSEYATSGSALYTVAGISGNVDASIIAWDEEKPDGTTISVSVSTDGMNFTPVTNGGQFIPTGAYDNATATIKVNLATEDTSTTPVMSSLRVSLQTAEDRNFLILEMEPLQRFCNAAGPITVAYAGGTLAGTGGPVADFSAQFTATDLLPKNHPHDMEHIDLSVQAAGVLTEVTYSDTAENEHIEIGVTASGVLTHIDDL